MATLLLRKTLFYNQLRTLHRSTVVFSEPITFNMFKNKEKFQEVLPEVMNSLMSSSKLTKQLPEVRSWLKHLLNCSMRGGKQSRGLAVPFAYKTMEDPKYLTEEKLHTARFLGWCLEMLQAELLAMDDIIDASTTRRGQPCWYLQPNVGTSAVNDCLLIHQCWMEVLEINFGKAPFYMDLLKCINEAIMYASIGQLLDYSSGYTKEKDNIGLFNMERFNAIAVQKTGHYSFRLPMLVALLLIRNGRERDITELSSICFDFGKLLQIQNDYNDVYLDEAAMGKVGSDIQEGKLTWMSVTALERCNEAQRSMFKEYYGSKNPEHVNKIKQLYDDLQIDKVFKKHKREVYENLERRIRALPTEGEAKFFLEMLEACRKQVF